MRKFCAFAVGLPRSGGQVISQMFGSYRTQFEPLAEHFIDVIMGGDQDSIDRLLKTKDSLGLEMEVSHLNVHVIGRLVELFPEAKFLLTVRDSFGWVCNAVSYYHETDEKNKLFCDWMYSTSDMKFPVEEQQVKEHNVYPLENYFRSWEKFNSLVMDVVPKDRLMVLKMFSMNEKRPAIANFLGIPVESLRMGHEPSGNLSMHSNVEYIHLQKLIKSVAETRNRLCY